MGVDRGIWCYMMIYDGYMVWQVDIWHLWGYMLINTVCMREDGISHWEICCYMLIYVGVDGGIWWCIMAIWFDKLIYDLCMRRIWEFVGVYVYIWWKYQIIYWDICSYVDIWWGYEVYEEYMGVDGGIWRYMIGIWFEKLIYDICMRCI